MEGTQLKFSMDNGKIRAVVNGYGDLPRLKDKIKGRFHLYYVARNGKYLVMHTGDLTVSHGGPEELDLTEQQSDEIRDLADAQVAAVENDD